MAFNKVDENTEHRESEQHFTAHNQFFRDCDRSDVTVTERRESDD